MIYPGMRIEISDTFAVLSNDHMFLATTLAAGHIQKGSVKLGQRGLVVGRISEAVCCYFDNGQIGWLKHTCMEEEK